MTFEHCSGQEKITVWTCREIGHLLVEPIQKDNGASDTRGKHGRCNQDRRHRTRDGKRDRGLHFEAFLRDEGGRRLDGKRVRESCSMDRAGCNKNSQDDSLFGTWRGFQRAVVP